MYPTIIKNNFFINPTEVTDLFNKVTMKKGGPNDNWPGVRSQNLIEINKKLYTNIVDAVLKLYFGERYSMCWNKIVIKNSSIYLHKIKHHDWFNHDKMNTRIHKDNCDLAGIIYLNQGNNEKTGTTIYDENKKFLTIVSNNYNSIALYDGNMYHGATALDEKDRLTIVMFFKNIRKLDNGY
jgi:hypothetical protein